MVIEPVESLPTLWLPHMVVKGEEEMPIYVVNTSPKRTTLKAGTLIGSAVACDIDTESKSSLESEQVPDQSCESLNTPTGGSSTDASPGTV